MEGYNPTGSLKDRSAKAILLDLKRKGLLENKTIVDASSGSFGCAIAYFGGLLNKPVTVVSNSKLTSQNKSFIKLMGAELIIHGDVTKESNEFCQKMIAENPDKYVFCDQLNNWESPKAHYYGTGTEILKEMPDVKAVVASMGSGATLWGVGTYLKEKDPTVKIIASIAAPGTSLAGTFKEGKDYYSPFIKDLEFKGVIDLKSEVTAEQALKNARDLARKGFFVGPQTGGVFQAAINAIEKFNISGKIVIISGDSGWKNMDRL